MAFNANTPASSRSRIFVCMLAMTIVGCGRPNHVEPPLPDGVVVSESEKVTVHGLEFHAIVESKWKLPLPNPGPVPVEVRLRMTNKTLHDVVFLNNHCYNLVLKDHNGKAIPNHRGSGWSESPPPPVIIGPGRGFAVLCDARLRWNHGDDAAAMSCLGKTGFWSVYSPLKAGKHSLSVHVCTIANKGWPLPKPPELAAWRYDVTASMSIPPGAEVTATPAVTFEIVAP